MANVRQETQIASASRSSVEFLADPWRLDRVLWVVGMGLAVLASLYLLLSRPQTATTWQADALNTAPLNGTNLYGPETDGSGQRFVWTQPAGVTLLLPVVSQNGRSLTITVRARGVSAAGGPHTTTAVTVNDQLVGEIKPVAGKAEFQDFSFTFVPAYRDNHALSLTFDSPTWKPKNDNRALGVALQAVSVDLQTVWSPLMGSGRPALLWILPGLVILAIIVRWLGRNLAGWRRWANLLGLGLLVVAACVPAFWLALLSRVGYNGLLNDNFFWLEAACALYLTVFLVGFALTRWTTFTNDTSLLRWADHKTRPWRQLHPSLTALAAIFGFNLALSLLFVGKIAIENNGLVQLFRYWDNPEYIVIAHGFYDTKDALLGISFFHHNSFFYWTAHFPGFPLLLMVVQPVVGWLWASLLINFGVSTAFAWVFYRLVRDFGYARHPLWLSLVALVLPIRWIVYHNVGASEPLFMLCEVVSLYCFKKERYWLAGLAGAGALFCRPPGLFLWIGFMLFLVAEAVTRTWPTFAAGGRPSLAILVRNFNWRAFGPLLLIPLALVGVFGLFAWRYGDFLAYFKITENVTHVIPAPFPTLSTGMMDSPGLLYTYIIEAVGLVFLWRQGRFDLFWVGLASFGYTLFLFHEDVLRYSIPFFALIVIIPFADYLSGRVARWLAAPVLLALLLYSWGVLHGNLMNIPTFEAMKNILPLNLK